MITPSSKRRSYFNGIRIGTDNVRPSNDRRHFMVLESCRFPFLAACPKLILELIYLANLRKNAIAEVNVIDPFAGKGYRFSGSTASSPCELKEPHRHQP